MTDMVTFRTSDLTRWGTGAGSRLAKNVIDINFWVLLSRVVALEDHSAVVGRGIEDIFIASGSDDQMYVALTDSTILGPFTLPKSTWNFTNPPSGAWLPSLLYKVNDVFTHNRSLYAVAVQHTSGSSFDPNATDGHGNNLYRVLFTLSFDAPVQTVTSSLWEPTIADANGYTRFSHPSSIVFQVPTDAAVDFLIGTVLEGRQASTGAVTVEPMSGVTVHPEFGRTLVSAGEGATFAIKKVGANEWDAIGNYAAGSP